MSKYVFLSMNIERERGEREREREKGKPQEEAKKEQKKKKNLLVRSKLNPPFGATTLSDMISLDFPGGEMRIRTQNGGKKGR